MRLLIALWLALTLTVGVACADEPAPPPASGWIEQTLAKVEAEAAADISTAPSIPTALAREWRSFDRNGSTLGAVVDFIWVALAALVAILAETAAARLLGRHARRRAETRDKGPGLPDLLLLLVCDLAGLAVFIVVFGLQRRHWLAGVGITEYLGAFATNVLVRWRIATVVLGAILRPHEAIGRLVEMPDDEANRLSRFLSAAILSIILLVGFGRLALMDEDSGAAHVIGLFNALLVCGIYVAIVFRARAAIEELIRGRRRSGVVAAIRTGLAQAWLSFALLLIAGLLVFFVAGLSLGLLSYYHAVTSTLGVCFIVLVLDRLTERVWHDEADRSPDAAPAGTAELQARTVHHIVRAIGLVIAAMVLAWIWIGVTGHSDAATEQALRSAGSAVGTLFIAFVAWELVRLAIDRHLLDASRGPALPGAGNDDEEAAPASRLQTILPLVRAAFAVVIGTLAALIVLSRLGVDTAPLIAGAGVFGLALSFGSQSLVRDIISGLFYMWDDAFRVGEYIDTGRLKGTVETLGIRSVKLRHQNGPLHTIPYGQLGAVTNLSRDYATIKFNLRLEPRTDIELVRKTAKQLGIAMQEDPEMAAEIILPLKLQGVAEVADNALVLRFKFTARPVKPSWVQREYLKRLVAAFAEKGIKFASGAMMIQTTPPREASGTEPTPPRPPHKPPSRSRRTAKTSAAVEPATVPEPAK